MDAKGSAFAQRHVAAFLQDATDSMLVMGSLPPMSRAYADQVTYDYPSMVETVIAKMSSLVTQTQLDEVAFFDDKVLISSETSKTLLAYGQTFEELALHTFGQSAAIYDSSVAVWKNKLQNSRIRPTTIINAMYPERRFTIHQNISLLGKHFQSLIRTMPHSVRHRYGTVWILTYDLDPSPILTRSPYTNQEYPSGSSCICQAIAESISELWPHLSLTSRGEPVSFDPASTPVVQNPIILTQGRPPSRLPVSYTAQTLNKRCGETREEGGMHFTPAVPAGRELCAGMGTAITAVVKTLVPGVVEGTTTIRSGLGSTLACGATCCAAEAECLAGEQAACAAECTGTWDLPWFDLVGARAAFFRVNRAMATFIQVDRHHMIFLSLVSFSLPFEGAETIYAARDGNTIDNLVWNAVAANSAGLLALKFGQSKVGQQPTIRSGIATSDARIATAVHAFAGALTLLHPAGNKAGNAAFKARLAYAVLSPTIGIDSSLSAACGAVENSETAFSASCLQAWYARKPGPARLGQTIAWELMYYKVRDGWNSLGTDGGCDAGPDFCPRYMDITDYDPETGACTEETLSE